MAMATALRSADRPRPGRAFSTETLTPEAETTLAEAWRRGDPQAGRRLVEANMHHVVGIAYEYRRWSVPLDDLIQQGSIGLLHAARRYDPSKGCRLGSYAGYWIRAEIRDYVVRVYRIVRLGTTRSERRAMRMYRSRPIESAEQLAEESGMPVGRCRLLWPLLAQRDRSLDVQYDDRSHPLDTLPGPEPTPEQILSDVEEERRRRQAVRTALEGLSERERAIVAARLLSDRPQTLEQLGATLGVSRERVRQLEQRARAKMRSSLESELVTAA